MRIHLITDQFSLGGGIEHIYQICKGLRDFHFKVFGKSGPAVEKFKSLSNVEINDKGFEPEYVLKGSPHLIHIHHLRPLMVFFKNPFVKYSIPIIFTAHGLHIHKYEFYKSLRSKIEYMLRFQLEKRVLPKTEKVIAVSLEDKQFLETEYTLSNVAYLTNGIDFSFMDKARRQSRQELRRKLQFSEEEFIFITVARFDFQKGYDVLIHAIAEIKDELQKVNSNRKYSFVFVGDGSEFRSMKQLSQTLEVSNFIRFLGARTDVYDILRAGDVCILPSRWEGLPIVLLESGLLNIPVIASETYGNREIIKGDKGILFKNQDPEDLAKILLDIIKNKYELNIFVENLYREIQCNYNLEKMLSGLRGIYSASV